MLTLADPRPAHTCQGYSRREFLRVQEKGRQQIQFSGGASGFGVFAGYYDDPAETAKTPKERESSDA